MIHAVPPVAPFVSDDLLGGWIEHHTPECDARSEAWCTCPGAIEGAMVDYATQPWPPTMYARVGDAGEARDAHSR